MIRALTLLACTLAAPHAAAAPCDGVDEVPVVDLVEPALLSGPLHRVRPCARIEGHMARFEIDTRFGPLVADSIGLLRVRVAELAAVEALERADLAVLAARSARSSAARSADAVARVASRPGEAMRELPAGALRFFQRRIDAVGDTARDATDRAGEQLTGAGEAYDRVSTRPGVVLAEPPTEPWWQRGGGRVWRLGKDWIGYGRTRRTWARRLGVDPYSSNPLLNQRMDRLAWAALAGDQAVGLAMGALSGGAQAALGAARRIDAMVWDLPPDDVRARNDARLAALRCGAAERRRFLRNGRFTPTLQTALVDALVDLQPTRGCVDVIELAAAVDVEVEARYLVDALGLLAGLHQRDAELLLVGTAPVLRVPVEPRPSSEGDRERTLHAHSTARRESGALDALAAAAQATPRFRLVLPLPVDRLEWTAGSAAFFDLPAFRVVDKQVLVGGDATQNALQGLTRRGWEVAERVAND
jgi:hypothetical protein